MDHIPIPYYTHLTVAAYETILYIASCHSTHLADAERLPHFGVALDRLLENRLQQTGHGHLHLIDQLINDRVQANIDLLLLGRRLCTALRAYVKANDDRIGGGSEQNIALGNGAHPGMQHTHANFIVRKPLESIGKDLGSAAHIGLDDEIQILDLTLLEVLVQGIQTRHAGALRHGCLACLAFAIKHDLLSLGRIRGNLERVAHLRQALEPNNFYRHGGLGLLHLVAAIIKHGANFAKLGAAKEVISRAQRPVPHENRGYWPAAPVKLGLQDRANGRPVRIGLELLHIRNEQNHFE